MRPEGHARRAISVAQGAPPRRLALGAICGCHYWRKGALHSHLQAVPARDRDRFYRETLHAGRAVDPAAARRLAQAAHRSQSKHNLISALGTASSDHAVLCAPRTGSTRNRHGRLCFCKLRVFQSAYSSPPLLLARQRPDHASILAHALWPLPTLYCGYTNGESPPAT